MAAGPISRTLRAGLKTNNLFEISRGGVSMMSTWAVMAGIESWAGGVARSPCQGGSFTRWKRPAYPGAPKNEPRSASRQKAPSQRGKHYRKLPLGWAFIVLSS